MEVVLAIATMLGGISAVCYFYDKIASRRSRPEELQFRSSTSFSSEVVGSTTGTLSESIPASVEASSVASRSLPLGTVLADLRDPRTTDLQKQHYIDKNRGRIVSWEAEVQSVKRQGMPHPTGSIMMVIAPVGKAKGFKDLATATFPLSEEVQLGALVAGDIVTIEGTLSFFTLGGPWSASVDNATLIRFQRK